MLSPVSIPPTLMFTHDDPPAEAPVSVPVEAEPAPMPMDAPAAATVDA